MMTSKSRPWAKALVLASIAFLVLVAVLFISPPARAQVLYGGLVGTVTDPQGGVLPGVTVTITNVGTGLTLETITDDTGNYVFRNLLPGTFDMTLALEGFTTMRRTGITVIAGTPRRE
ncbi:MAG TPA: carboxypeptidase-like regulatory domain-containing protein, partial [Acidobacteriota bacterium]|nr:carboxypeptidase-like regulatory domain-containing protein [Acidobacteriota bacterium]